MAEAAGQARTRAGDARTRRHAQEPRWPLARLECDLVFNLTESFADDDTADFKIAGVPSSLIGKQLHGLRARTG